MNASIRGFTSYAHVAAQPALFTPNNGYDIHLQHTYGVGPYPGSFSVAFRTFTLLREFKVCSQARGGIDGICKSLLPRRKAAQFP